MPYNYQLSEEAESDVYDSYRWYENQKEGLGEQFLNALDTAEQAITNNPQAYSFRYKKKVKGFVVDRFPYLIMYILSGNNIDVLSVFNTNQHPKKWKNRLK
jgi:toxin ParE1/3/4